MKVGGSVRPMGCPLKEFFVVRGEAKVIFCSSYLPPDTSGR